MSSFEFVSPVFEIILFIIFFNAILIKRLFFLFYPIFIFIEPLVLKICTEKKVFDNKCDVIIIYDLVCMHSVCVYVCA